MLKPSAFIERNGIINKEKNLFLRLKILNI